jgi:hypothetical protein
LFLLVDENGMRGVGWKIMILTQHGMAFVRSIAIICKVSCFLPAMDLDISLPFYNS